MNRSHFSKSCPPAAIAGFSLMELMISVGIIVLLAALVLPSAGRIYEGSKAAKCQSNLRQLGTALQAYRADHDGSLPKVFDTVTSVFWFQQLVGTKGAYLDSPTVLTCPGKKDGTPWPFNPPTRIGYGMLDAMLWYPTTHRSQEESRLMLRVQRPSQWPLLMDADYPAVYGLDNPTKDAARDSRYAARHNLLANILMADGHIEQVAYGDKRWHQKNLNENFQ
ncbi:MAG: type II secretion system protein [Verrucomicrobia bacterium]|nr:type II secretion system protein [Verrucomicrobiota bacterium]